MVDVVRLMSCMAIVILMMLSVMAMRLLRVMLNRPVSVHSRHHARKSPCSTGIYYACVLLVVALIVHGAIWVVLGRRLGSRRSRWRRGVGRGKCCSAAATRRRGPRIVPVIVGVGIVLVLLGVELLSGSWLEPVGTICHLKTPERWVVKGC